MQNFFDKKQKHISLKKNTIVVMTKKKKNTIVVLSPLNGFDSQISINWLDHSFENRTGSVD